MSENSYRVNRMDGSRAYARQLWVIERKLELVGWTVVEIEVIFGR